MYLYRLPLILCLIRINPDFHLHILTYSVLKKLLTWNNISVKKFLFFFFSIILLLSLINLNYKLIPLLYYGDHGSLDVIVKQGRPFTRWFLGSTALIITYYHFWLPFFSKIFIIIPYIQLLSTLVLGISTLLLIKSFGNKLFLVLPIFSPLWILFSTGYDEYYPFIAPVYLLLLIWIYVLKKESKTKDIVFIGALIGLLPLVYIGFAPISLLLFIYFFMTNPNRAPLILISSITFFCLAILKFWPFGFHNFFFELIHQMNLGEISTEYPKYFGKSASVYSTNFNISYTLSPEHLKDLVFMVIFGGGLLNLLLLLIGLYYTIKDKLSHHIIPPLSLRILTIAIIAQQTYYLFFMIPKMGPVKDIDLFFSVYITWGFFAGIIWEYLSRNSKFNGAKFLIFTLNIIYTCIISYFLLFKGLPLQLFN